MSLQSQKMTEFEPELKNTLSTMKLNKVFNVKGLKRFTFHIKLIDDRRKT